MTITRTIWKGDHCLGTFEIPDEPWFIGNAYKEWLRRCYDKAGLNGVPFWQVNESPEAFITFLVDKAGARLAVDDRYNPDENHHWWYREPPTWHSPPEGMVLSKDGWIRAL